MTINKKPEEAIKLNVGCGTVYMDGWINIDNNSDNNIEKLDLNWDLRNPLPFENNSVDFIYNEHFLEHLSLDEGVRALADFKRVLKLNGVLRIAMPNLQDVIDFYNDLNWKQTYSEMIDRVGFKFIKTRAEFLNINMRWWGHRWLYDYEELERRLKDAGFGNITPCRLNESQIPELRDLETRDESTLIMEAQKTNNEPTSIIGTQKVGNEFTSIAEIRKTRRKIPCFVIAFFDFETIKKSVDFITKYSDRLDINIVENRSDYTEGEIKPYILKLLEEGKISNYYLFDENIGGSALETIVKANHLSLKDYDYFMCSDADLICEDDNWLDEQISIMENNPEVFASGLELDLSNLPLKSHPEATGWVPKAKNIEGKNYAEGPTGGWFTLFRTSEMFTILKQIERSGEKPVDGVLAKYCYLSLHKKWARTKKSKAYHITWDLYANPEHPYTKWKGSCDLNDLWHHDRYCGFALYTADSAKHYSFGKKNMINLTESIVWC